MDSTDLDPRLLDPVLGRKIRALRERKRFLDLFSILLTAPLIVAYAWEICYPHDDVPDWVTDNLRPWIVIFILARLARTFFIRCPGCQGRLRVGRSGEMFAPLPVACADCGLRLRAGKARTAPETGGRVSLPNEREGIRPGVIWGSAIALGIGFALAAPPRLAPVTANFGGIALGGIWLAFMYFVRWQTGRQRRCTACGKPSSGGAFCVGCGASLAK